MTASHIAITMHGIATWATKHQLTIDEAYNRAYEVLHSVIKHQIITQTPIYSIYMIPEDRQQSPNFSTCVQHTTDFLKTLINFAKEHQLKVTVLGKWYDLPQPLIEEIKTLIFETKEYDKLFLNLCMNYNGKEEILDACKLLARKVKAGKLDPDSITQEHIKENIYTSAFLPPNIIIKNGTRKEVTGFLLWDAVEAYLHETQIAWPDFTPQQIEKAVENWEKSST